MRTYIIEKNERLELCEDCGSAVAIIEFAIGPLEDTQSNSLCGECAETQLAAAQDDLREAS